MTGRGRGQCVLMMPDAPTEAVTGIVGRDAVPVSMHLRPQAELASLRSQARQIKALRDQVAFGAAFLPGSINIGMRPNSVNWLGMVVDAASEIIVVADSEADAREAAFRFRRAGYDRLIGYLADGVSGWAMQGKQLDHLPQLTVDSLKHVLAKYSDHVVLDVRTDAEWQNGHIEGAVHTPISDLIQDGTDLPKQMHITAVCGSGYRSNIAGSFLKSLGYDHVFSLIGGMTAWNAALRTA